MILAMGKNKSVGADGSRSIPEGGHPPLLERWKQRANELKIQTYTLYLAYRDPRTPWYAKVWAALVVAYAVSPIDLIPDFIPVIGYLDDLVLVPAGIALALKIIPPEVMEEARKKVKQAEGPGRSVGWVTAAVIVLVWVLVTVWLIVTVIKFLQRSS
jgi:uncharacterized membrane protein YkvA (DUF1232 family)